MSYPGYRVDAGNAAVGVAERFKVNCLGVGLNDGFDSVRIVNVHKRGLNSELRQSVGKQAVTPAVNVF